MNYYQQFLSTITAYIPKTVRFKPYLVWGSIAISSSVLLFPGIHLQFAGVAWGLFVVTMLIRPVTVLWPRVQKKWEILRHPLLGIVGIVLRFGMLWRRQLGILAAVFGIAHGAGALLSTRHALTDVFSPELWNFGNLWGWGLLGLAAMLPPLVTSNTASVKFLRRHWKTLQSLAYVAFVATGVHVTLVTREPGPVLAVVAWGILWWLARKKLTKKCLWQKRIDERKPRPDPHPTARPRWCHD